MSFANLRKTLMEVVTHGDFQDLTEENFIALFNRVGILNVREVTLDAATGNLRIIRPDGSVTTLSLRIVEMLSLLNEINSSMTSNWSNYMLHRQEYLNLLNRIVSDISNIVIGGGDGGDGPPIDLSNLDVRVSTRAASADVGLRSDAATTTINNTNTLISMTKGLLGAVNATGGSQTAGGANAKLNRIIADLATLIANGGSGNGGGPGFGGATVQRGTHNGVTNFQNLTISINTVIPERCFVILHPNQTFRQGGGSSEGGEINNFLPRLVSLTSDSFVVTPSYASIPGIIGVPFSWQVIQI